VLFSYQYSILLKNTVASFFSVHIENQINKWLKYVLQEIYTRDHSEDWLIDW
jgi:hypothetical protein